jgi:hypothetical protein
MDTDVHVRASRYSPPPAAADAAHTDAAGDAAGDAAQTDAARDAAGDAAGTARGTAHSTAAGDAAGDAASTARGTAHSTAANASRRLPTAPQSPRVRRLAAGFWGHGRGCARRGSDGTERGFANSENGARRGYEAGGHGLTEKSAGAPLATRRRRRRPLLAAAAAHAAARCRSGRVAEPLK